ncbi:MAG: hypothetical protein ACYDCO_08055 [Armatimonadota bacterium]
MSVNDLLLSRLNGLELTRLGDEGPAGLCVTSLPLPRGASQAWGLGGQATHVKPLGKWPDAPGPRRLLLAADAGGQAPETISLTPGGAQPAAAPPAAEMETFEYAPASNFPKLLYWERSMLKIQWNGRWVALAMGMRVRDEIHWWEYCNIDQVEKTASCTEVEMGGAIPHELTTPEMMDWMHAGNPTKLIHFHNWLNGHIYARLHANGVCEVYAHHVNSMFADDGRDLEEAVPVIGIRVAESEEALNALCGSWDGSVQTLELGGVAFDLTDVSRMATPEQPGRVDLVDGFLVLQPYLGMQCFGGKGQKKRPRNDDYYWRAEEKVIPRGRARTLRFSLSLNPERSPRVVRYAAPAWWYGLCEEFQPEPLLPVSNSQSVSTDSARAWALKYMIPHGVEEGILPNQSTEDPSVRQTPGCEGDRPGALFLAAYRSGEGRDYDCALRAAYAFTDIEVDHAVNRVICWPFGPDAVALPLQRALGPLFGYLETGDPYLLHTARAIIDTAYTWHKNSWPRRAIGRDAVFVHSMVHLYRYLGDEHYRLLARDVIRDIGVSQWPNGPFGDQGGGAGIHGAAAYIIKPWMGMLATMGILDYLEVVPDDKEAFAIVQKFVDWMMSERAPRHGRKKDKDHKDTIVGNGWTYMHNFKGKTLPGITMPDGPTTGMHLMHLEYLARLLPWFSFITGDPQYFDAYMESYEAGGPERQADYWNGAATLFFIPWLQDRLWDARLTEDGVVVRPSYFGDRTPKTGTIATPDGPVTLTWTAPDQLDVPEGAKVIVEGDKVAAK